MVGYTLGTLTDRGYITHICPAGIVVNDKLYNFGVVSKFEIIKAPRYVLLNGVKIENKIYGCEGGPRIGFLREVFELHVENLETLDCMNNIINPLLGSYWKRSKFIESDMHKNDVLIVTRIQREPGLFGHIWCETPKQFMFNERGITGVDSFNTISGLKTYYYLKSEPEIVKFVGILIEGKVFFSYGGNPGVLVYAQPTSN